MGERAEQHQFGIDDQRLEVYHRAYTDKQKYGQSLRTVYTDAVKPLNDPRFVALRQYVGKRNVYQYRAETDGQQQGGFHFFLDCKKNQNSADKPHDDVLPCYGLKGFDKKFHKNLLFRFVLSGIKKTIGGAAIRRPAYGLTV